MPADPPMIFRDWPCHDCGADTSDEYYWLKLDIWAEAIASDPVRFLCIGCLERRLRRRVIALDFDFVAPDCSARLCLRANDRRPDRFYDFANPPA